MWTALSGWKFSCELDACHDMELVVWTNESQYRIMDTHLVEWSGLVNGSVSWELLANPSLVTENFAMRSIIGEQSDIIEIRISLTWCASGTTRRMDIHIRFI